ncbi:hypothetical protein C8R46DRAFT_1228881 [Mycena filopes]|nr:hypothetical protein C8R46DRAFT_1228881 [Mycena filopes]
MLVRLDSTPEAGEHDSEGVADRAESPPAYAGSQLPAGPSIPSPPPISNTIKPANFLSLSRINATIKGTHVIDPYLKIPPFLLRPLAKDETEETRKNVRLETTKADIDVEFFIVGDGEGKERQRVNILLKTTHGYMYQSNGGGKPDSQHAADAPTRPAIRLTVDTTNDGVTLRLPRSFRGLVRFRADRAAYITFSDALTANLTTFYEVNNTHAPLFWDEVFVTKASFAIKLAYDVEAPHAEESCLVS